MCYEFGQKALSAMEYFDFKQLRINCFVLNEYAKEMGSIMPVRFIHVSLYINVE